MKAKRAAFASAAKAASLKSGSSAELVQKLRSKENTTSVFTKPTDERKQAPKPAREADVANAILSIEREARRAESEAELSYVIVNASRVAVPYRQALLLMRSGAEKHRTIAVSSLSAIDRNSTFIRWVESLAAAKLKDADGKAVVFDVRREAAASDLDASSYPFTEVAFLPLILRDGTVFAHLMLTRETRWDDRGLAVAARLCETFSHAWEMLTGPRRAKRRMRSKTVWIAAACIATLLAGFMPVSLNALAPAEVVPADPFIVAAPIDGTVETVTVDPNTPVRSGQKLFTYNDTDLRNQLQLAAQAVSVAEARYQQALRTSFADASAKRELSIAQSELALKASEYDYARELLAKTEVVAKRDGLIIFPDKESLTGRPVATGERIMRIADPGMVELRVDLPVSDAIVLEPGAAVQLYLDANPLKAIDANLESASFHATPDGDGTLAYRVRARFDQGESGALPRIGLRGTAKVYGERVSLAYFLFRKPLAAIRQWTGI